MQNEVTRQRMCVRGGEKGELDLVLLAEVAAEGMGEWEMWVFWGADVDWGYLVRGDAVVGPYQSV